MGNVGFEDLYRSTFVLEMDLLVTRLALHNTLIDYRLQLFMFAAAISKDRTGKKNNCIRPSVKALSSILPLTSTLDKSGCVFCPRACLCIIGASSISRRQFEII